MMSGYSGNDGVGGGYPGGYSPGELGGCQQNVCNCITVSMTAIQTAIQQLTVAFTEQAKPPCDDIDYCMDKIIAAVDKRWRKAMGSCEECKAMAAAGLSGTLDYAVQCAGVVCKEATCECSPGDESCWGQPCEGCGEPCCICEDGYCVPTDCAEPPKKKQYAGYCKSDTGQIMVLLADSPPPGVGWFRVALGDDEQTVAIEAAKNCSKQEYEQPYQQSEIPRSSLEMPFCSLDLYGSGQALQQLATFGTAINRAGAIAEAAGSLSKLGLDGINIGNISELVTGLFNVALGTPPLMVSVLSPMIADAIGCQSFTTSSLINTMATFGMAQKYMGLDLSDYVTPYKYALNMSCRQKHMTPGESMMAYLANAITDYQLDTLWGVNGLCPDDVKWSKQASKAKPIPRELMNMRLRGIINENGYHDGMRQIGYLESGVREDLFKLTQQLPTLSEIIRLMVRDADDETANGPVVKFNLDSNFADKYGGQLREWSQQTGVPEKLAKYAWRAHWSIPSPTQLFTFWHRLRDNPAYKGLQGDIEAALIQQDILPYWHKHFFATSYLPLGRIDIRRSFNIGTLKESELLPSFRHLGYSDEDCERLIQFSKRLRRDSLLSHRAIRQWTKFAINGQECQQRLAADGFQPDEIALAMKDSEQAFAVSTYGQAFVRGEYPRQDFQQRLADQGVSAIGAKQIIDKLAVKIVHSPAINEYVVGTKDRDDCRNDALQYGVDPVVLDRLLLDADQKIDHVFVANCTRGIKRRYLMGELDKQAATNALLSRQVTLTRANRLVDWWDCERDANGRAVAANRLCDWLAKGIITSVDFQQRLQRIGYNEDDASRIVNDCLVSTNQKLLAQAKRDAKEQAAADLRAARNAARANAAIVRESARLTRINNKRADTRLRREKQLMSAADKMQQKCQCDLGTALTTVKQQQQVIVNQYGLDIDESLAILIVSAEEWTGGDPSSYSLIVANNAQLAAGSHLQPPIDPVSGEVITGG